MGFIQTRMYICSDDHLNPIQRPHKIWTIHSTKSHELKFSIISSLMRLIILIVEFQINKLLPKNTVIVSEGASTMDIGRSMMSNYLPRHRWAEVVMSRGQYYIKIFLISSCPTMRKLTEDNSLRCNGYTGRFGQMCYYRVL